MSTTTKRVVKRSGARAGVPGAKVARQSPSVSLSFLFLSVSLSLSLPQPGYTNKLDQTDSRWVVRVVWIRALLRPDSNLRSWVDFSLGHWQIYLAAAVVARFVFSIFVLSLSLSLSSLAIMPLVAYRYVEKRENKLRGVWYASRRNCAVIVESTL